MVRGVPVTIKKPGHWNLTEFNVQFFLVTDLIVFTRAHDYFDRIVASVYPKLDARWLARFCLDK